MTAPDAAPAGRDRTYDSADGSGGSGVKSQIRDVKNQVVDQAKTTLTQARDSAASSLTDSKVRLADQVTHVADAFRSTTDHLRQNDQAKLAGYADGIAQQAERFAGYLRNADFRAMGADVRELARRQPAVVVGGAFALGLLAARFLKSSERKTRDESSASFHRGGYAEQSFTDGGFESYGSRAGAYDIPGAGYASGGGASSRGAGGLEAPGGRDAGR
jgi:glucan phosphorylase